MSADTGQVLAPRTDPPLSTVTSQRRHRSSKRRGWRDLLFGFALVVVSAGALVLVRGPSDDSAQTGSTSFAPTPTVTRPAPSTTIDGDGSEPDTGPGLGPAQPEPTNRSPGTTAVAAEPELASGPTEGDRGVDVFGLMAALGGLGGFGSMLTGVAKLITSGRGDEGDLDEVEQAPTGPTPGYL